MKALIYRGPRDIACESVDEPRPLAVTDAVVRTTLCAICGSDLHIYHGHGFSDALDFCVGHEAVGEVMEVGSGVRRLKVGDRVMISAAVGCGACAPCLAGNVNACETGAAACYGLSSKLQGCQAEAVRVPMADFNAAPIPEGLTEAQALMLTDAQATAWMGARNARIQPGWTVVVVGLGPIGLMAVEAAMVMGAGRVFAVDLDPGRRAHAEALGAEAFDAEEAKARIDDLTRGRRCDAAIECVGSDAAIRSAISLVGRGGVVSCIGVNQTRDFVFPMALAFTKGLTFVTGTCSVPEHWPELVPLVRAGRLRPERFISHTLPLSEGAHAYDLFDRRAEGALKMVLQA